MLVGRGPVSVGKIQKNKEYRDNAHKVTPNVKCFVVNAKQTKEVVVPGPVHRAVACKDGGFPEHLWNFRKMQGV